VLVVGLTGNYGMGKSTVLRMFRDLGAVTLDADKVVDMLLDDADVLRRIRDTFGNGVFSKEGSLDRSTLASIIFKDKEKRDSLEGILHPLVFEKIGDFLAEIGETETGEEIVVVEIPLLFEKGYTGRFDWKITVYAEEDIALKRLEGKAIGREGAVVRLKAQMPIKEKIRMADFAINNSGTLEETEKQVREIYDKLLVDLGRMKR
jgi:dephospho-CoA kinase